MNIENDITYTPNIYIFNGKEYDLQLNMYVISQFEDFNEVLNSLGKIDTVFRMATAMMNSDTKKRGIDRPMLEPDYVASCTNMSDMPALTSAVAKAMGLKEKTEAEKELDAALEGEDIPDIKN